MDASQCLDDRLARGAPLRGRERFRSRHVAHDRAVDELHHVERCAVHLLVFAQADHRRDRDVGGTQGREDLVLTTHVVCGGQHVTERRPA